MGADDGDPFQLLIVDNSGLDLSAVELGQRIHADREFCALKSMLRSLTSWRDHASKLAEAGWSLYLEVPIFPIDCAQGFSRLFGVLRIRTTCSDARDV